MKTKLYFTLNFVLICLNISAQFSFTQYFDGADTIQGQSVFVTINPSPNNIWQIGKPSKSIFDSAATFPNVIATDTKSPYPINNVSSFQFTVGSQFGNGSILAVRWKQKLNMDAGLDGAKIEFSGDSGATWQNVFNNPYVYNFYGYDITNIDTLPNGDFVFSGTDTTWRDIWLCFNLNWLNSTPNKKITVKYTFTSDAINTNKEGWMIDNLMTQLTLIHTLGSEIQKDYITVYPNPTNDVLHIQARKVKDFHIIENMELVDLDGRVIEKWENIPTKFFINVKKYMNGQYYLKIKTNIRSTSIPVVIQHK